MSTEIVAYAYRSGQIGFTSRASKAVPSGALIIASGPKKTLESIVNGLSRLAYDNHTRLVPGVPESEDEMKALDALMVFKDRVTVSLNRRMASSVR